MKIYHYKINAQNKLNEPYNEFIKGGIHLFTAVFHQVFDYLKGLGKIINDPNGFNDEADWYDIKNYKWLAFEKEGMKGLARWYHAGHLTLIFKDTSKKHYNSNPYSFVTISTDDELRAAMIKIQDLENGEDLSSFQTDEWEDITPCAKHAFNAFGTDDFNILFTHSVPKYVKMITVFKGETISDYHKFLFVLEELESVNQYLLSEHILVDFLRPFVGMKFNIPASNGVRFTGIVEKEDKWTKTKSLFFVKIDNQEKESLESLWDITHFNFKAIYNFFSCCIPPFKN